MSGSCCGPGPSTKNESIKKVVREHYAALAQQGRTCCSAGSTSCCGDTSPSIAPDYSVEELKNMPQEAAAASAGCGNPTAIAGLNEGETVLDLGSGGGIDVLLAAEKVGKSGKVIGVDMTPEMVSLARRNAEQSGHKNLEFRLGEIENLPVADKCVDVIISNCVINLSTDKDSVFREAYRALKSGGRLVVSDIMAEGLPGEQRDRLSLWASCVGGALPLSEYLAKITEAGFKDVKVLANAEYPRELVLNSVNADCGDDVIEKISISHAEVQAYKY